MAYCSCFQSVRWLTVTRTKYLVGCIYISSIIFMILIQRHETAFIWITGGGSSNNGVHITSSNIQFHENIKKIASTPQRSVQNSLPQNILIFYPDDWRHDDLGDTNPHMKTPFFTQLAKEGIRFTHNAVTTSICWISRATLFTGQYVTQHKSLYLFRPKFAHEKERWENTWPYLLQRAGYFVGHVGKWQYRDMGRYKGSIFNFSSYFEGFYWTKDGTHITDLAQNEALRFLKQRPKDKPFALTVAMYPPKGACNREDVHPSFFKIFENMSIPMLYDPNEALKLLPPFLQSNSTLARSRYNYRFVSPNNYSSTMRSFHAMITQLDSVCSEIVKELKRQGVYNQTMIIVTADNGEFHSAHGLSDKWYPYQESIRVPLIIYDPRMPLEKRGTLDDSFTLNVSS
jgi:arylsulfatase